MRKEWVAWLLLASLLLSGCGKTAQVPDEAQAAEEAVIQVETPTEEPAQASGISPIEPGQWEKYAEIYDAYFLGEDRRLPLDFMFARPILQMADLDQNGVPELIVYHGVATAMMIFAIFTIEDDTVKSLTELLSWNWAMPTAEGDCIIPTTETRIPDAHQEILCDSAYVALDVRVLPFDLYYGAISARRDVETGEAFWMFSCYNNKTVDIDGVSCNSGGEYWRFANEDGKIVPVLVQRFGIDYDDETPFAGYSQVFPDEEPEWIEEMGSQAPVVDGKTSAELTERFVSRRDDAYPELDSAPEECKFYVTKGTSNEELLQDAHAFFTQFSAPGNSMASSASNKTEISKRA